MVRLEDFIGNENEEPEVEAAAGENEPLAVEAAAIANQTAESTEATDETEKKEPGVEEEPPAPAPSDDDQALLALVEEYGGEDEIKDALGFFDKFIAGDEEEQDQQLVEFAKEMAAISPSRYHRFTEMIVQKFAPQYGFEKTEIEEPEAVTEFEDDDYETEREKTLAEENARLRAQVAQETEGKQQTVEQQRETAFMETLGSSVHALVSGLNLHPDIAEDALKDICLEVAAAPEFKRAQKAAVADDGKRVKALLQEVQQKTNEILQAKVDKYVRRSNAQKAYDANTQPKTREQGQPALDTVPAAHVTTEIPNKSPLPKRGAPLSAYA